MVFTVVHDPSHSLCGCGAVLLHQEHPEETGPGSHMKIDICPFFAWSCELKFSYGVPLSSVSCLSKGTSSV